MLEEVLRTRRKRLQRSQVIRMGSNPLYLTGERLVAGVYRLKDECGFPIDASYDYCNDKGLHIDWMEALACALSQGLEGVFKMDSLLKEIKMLIPNEYDGIILRWKIVFMQAYFTALCTHSNEHAIYKACEIILKDKGRRG